ncbi:MAG: hypothetical protein RL259_627 [Bacteroidota bacterium]|jgi:uncharacterized protein (TIGR02145 family)
MKKNFLFLLLSIVGSVQAQIGIDTDTPNSSAILDLSTTNKGLLLPRLTSTQRDASDGILSPVGGIVIYDSTSNCLLISLDNGKWKNACTGEEVSTTSGITTSTAKTAIGITSALDNNTILEVVSNSKGVLLPRATADLASVTGMLYYNTTDNSIRLYNGTSWVTLLANAGDAPYPPGTVHCNPSYPTEIVDVTSPTGKVWMDRNLGAFRAATASDDAQSYGSLYQWGRGSDGHQCVNRFTGDGVTTSSDTSTLSSLDTPGHGNYITTSSAPNNWRNPQNLNLWQGANGTNNPCPNGYRIPTSVELEAERASWVTNNAAGAFASPLKISLAGARSISNYPSALQYQNSDGRYWSSTNYNANASNHLSISGGNSSVGYSNRATGESVRCIKN